MVTPAQQPAAHHPSVGLSVCVSCVSLCLYVCLCWIVVQNSLCTMVPKKVRAVVVGWVLSEIRKGHWQPALVRPILDPPGGAARTAGGVVSRAVPA